MNNKKKQINYWTRYGLEETATKLNFYARNGIKEMRVV